MNKQELLKQADYTFQRGNRALAGKFLLDLLAAYPNDEAAWMLYARVVEEKERRIDAYERVLRINPNNNEAKIGLIRIKSISPTLPLNSSANENPWHAGNPVQNILRSVILVLVILIGLGTTTYAIARNNPESDLGKLILPATATPFVQTLPQDVAPQTRAQVGTKYPQYAPLVEAVIGLALDNADHGMDGAPERPGAEIVPFEAAGEEARTKLLGALPQPGSLSSITLNEQQVTSWLMLELKKIPDLPLRDIQVYLRDDKIQIWGMVTGSTDSTSTLVTGKLTQDVKGRPGVEIDSVQIGPQAIPDFLVAQAETWLNQLITDEINDQLSGLQIMNINISNGLITISGMR